MESEKRTKFKIDTGIIPANVDLGLVSRQSTPAEAGMSIERIWQEQQQVN